jgi:hypothetical protein
MTRQSFSEARQKLCSEACRELFLYTAESSVSTFKDRLILRALLESRDGERAAKTDEIIRLLCEHLVPERKGRSVPRNSSHRKARIIYVPVELREKKNGVIAVSPDGGAMD